MIRLIYLKKLLFFDPNPRRSQVFSDDMMIIIFFIFFDEVMESMKVDSIS
jgi:hypothetical protein